MLPNTRFVADRVIVLPTGPALDAEGIRSIAAVLRTASSATDPAVAKAPAR